MFFPHQVEALSVTNKVSFVVDEPGAVFKSYSPGVCTQSGSKRRLMSRLQGGKDIATAPPSRSEFVGAALIKIYSLLCRSTVADNFRWLRALLQRLDLVLDPGPSPPAVSASAAVRFIFGHSSQPGGSEPCRGLLLLHGRGSRSEVERRHQQDDAESLKWRPQPEPTEKDGS